ncbi:TPA: thioredoxin-disulfide reductase [Candidatus Poribacteria bacterium]|nr:thioredoxin-disulfide reductase [Candidatus Poribacteria bacterium]
MAKVKMYSKAGCPFCERAKRILDKYGVEYDEIEVTGRPELREEIRKLTGYRWDVPQIFINDRYIGDDDDLDKLDRSGRLEKMLKEADWDVAILGSGPAGLTAAIYCGRAELRTVVITGREIGGQIALTESLENFPGFPEGIPGVEFVQLLQKQAEKFKAQFEFDDVTEVDLSSHPFRLKTYGGELTSKSIIIATGASPRKLGVPGEAEYTGRGVSYCAVCDGFFYRDKKVAVVGGGDSAVEEGIYLTKFADEVIIIHRRDRLRASQLLQDMAFANEKISFVWDSVVEEIVGDENGVKGVKIRNVKTDERSQLDVEGVFIYIGHEPNTKMFEGQLDMDEHGFIITDGRQRTSVEGVFAAGDVQDPLHRQAVVAAGTGAVAAMEAERFIAALEGRSYPGGP